MGWAHSTMRFIRSVSISAWTGPDRVGLEFAYMIDEQEVLVQLKRTTNDQNQPRFRRDGIAAIGRAVASS